jgi:hypothetical protein
MRSRTARAKRSQRNSPDLEALADLIEAQDLNGLLRAVDGLCDARDWDGLVGLAEDCEAAVERGKQLWPIAEHIDYRLALEAPAPYAADVLTTETGRFSPAPLTEVAAFNHEWGELAPHIESLVAAAYVAQERVLRGEDLSGDDRAHSEVLELPLRLQEWEPTYALAHFKSNDVEVAEPWDAKKRLASFETAPAPIVEVGDIEEPILDLVTPWTNESNGVARAVVVEGDAVGAASNLTPTLRIGTLSTQEAIQRIAWAAASGGAHGRRRGAALGRFMAWYVASVLCALPWPATGDELGEGIDGLKFYRWDEGTQEEGWVLRLAIEMPGRGLSVAIAATDRSDEDLPAKT